MSATPPLPETPIHADARQQGSGLLGVMPCSALFAWMERYRIKIDIDTSLGGRWWRLYVEDPGGHYMEYRIKPLASAPTILEAAEKAIERNPERYPFPWQNAGLSHGEGEKRS